MKIRVRRVGLGGISLVLAIAAWAGVDQLANGAVTKAWVRQNNSVVSNSQDVASAILRDPFGNIIVAGNTEDGFAGDGMLLLKYSANGALLWHRRFSGQTNGSGVIAAAAVDAHGNIAITGYSSNGEDNDYYTAKFSPEGTLIWARSYDGPSDDSALAVAFDKSGNVIVTGGSSQDEWRNDDDGYTRYDYYTAKYAAADGAVLWERRYNGPGNGRDRAQALAVDASNNVIVTGSSASEIDVDQYTAKYAAADGAALWERRQAGFSAGQALAFDASDNVIIGGGSAGNAHTVKYSGVDGTLLWEQLRNGIGGVSAVAVDRSGNVIVTGGLDPGAGWAEAYTAKYAEADGAVLWEQLYNDPAYYHRSGQAVAVDGSGNVIMGGLALNSDGWTADQYVAKYAGPDGEVLWQRLQRGPQIYAGAVAGLVLDEAGNAFVTGSSIVGKDLDIVTRKYAGADGATLWQQYYNGPAHREGIGQAAVIDSHGNVIVTGYSEGDDTSMDYLTVKYAPNGAVLWERRYNGPGNDYDDPRGGVALDPQGNVIVSGQSYGMGSGVDFYTAKYAASDGALLWEQRYNGPANHSDGARALAVDREGNVLVTGFSYKTGNGNEDFYTAKYAGGDGAMLWERRFTMPTGYASAQAIAVDGSGNVVVTGTVWTGPSSNRSDIYTVKYAAADGQTLWERQYNSPNNGYDEAVAMAMDGEGNVFVTARSDDSYTVKYGAATGEVIWEQHHNRGWPWALAVDAQGNAIISSGYTVKYAASNGAVLWDRTIEDSPNQTTFVRAIAVDATGNVFLGGMFYNGSNYDFFTAKYAAADGAALWRQNDDGPGHADDSVESDRALAIGPNGMVALTGSSGGYYPFAHDFTTVVYRETSPPPSPSVNVFALDPYARERSFFYRADTASFLVHRSGSLNSDLTIYYDLAGSASNGVDYLQLPGRVTIRAGHRVALVVIVPQRDFVREGREDVRIALRPPPVGAAPYRIGKYPKASAYIFE